MSEQGMSLELAEAGRAGAHSRVATGDTGGVARAAPLSRNQGVPKGGAGVIWMSEHGSGQGERNGPCGGVWVPTLKVGPSGHGEGLSEGEGCPEFCVEKLSHLEPAMGSRDGDGWLAWTWGA